MNILQRSTGILKSIKGTYIPIDIKEIQTHIGMTYIFIECHFSPPALYRKSSVVFQGSVFSPVKSFSYLTILHNTT